MSATADTRRARAGGSAVTGVPKKSLEDSNVPLARRPNVERTGLREVPTLIGVPDNSESVATAAQETLVGHVRRQITAAESWVSPEVPVLPARGALDRRREVAGDVVARATPKPPYLDWISAARVAVEAVVEPTVHTPELEQAVVIKVAHPVRLVQELRTALVDAGLAVEAVHDRQETAVGAARVEVDNDVGRPVPIQVPEM